MSNDSGLVVLWRGEDELVAHAHDGLADVDAGVVEVDVLSAESEYFASPHTGHCRYSPCGSQSVFGLAHKTASPPTCDATTTFRGQRLSSQTVSAAPGWGKR